MKYEDFEKFIREKCMYETIYDDSDGRQILVIKMLDAYGMVNKAQPEPAECDGGQCGIGGYCKQCPKTQPEPEPVAWRIHDGTMWCYVNHINDLPQPKFEPLYTVPLQREWQGLTDEEIADMHHEIKVKGMGAYKTEDIYRAIEAKLKEKNG